MVFVLMNIGTNTEGAATGFAGILTAFALVLIHPISAPTPR
ncbi:hypothetical protein ABZT49_01290 [Methylobacterium sp. EM32]